MFSAFATASRLVRISRKTFKVSANFCSHTFVEKSNAQLFYLYKLATKSIKIIKKNKRVDDRSLNDQILLAIKQENVSQQAKDQISALFTTGVHLDPEIYSQKRIPDQIIQKQENEQKIIFCPTYFGTSKVFNKIQEPKSNEYLLSGQFELSKTFSTVLYSKLSDYVIDYRINTPSVKNITYQIIRIPKIVYFDINLSKFQRKFTNLKQFLLEILNKQFTSEVKVLQKRIQKGQKINIDFQAIKKLYQQNHIQLCLIVDQIYYLASIAKKNLLKLKQERKKDYQIYYKFRGHIFSIMDYFDSLIYISRANLTDEQILNKLDLRGTFNQSKILKRTINFFQDDDVESYIEDMIDFYIFQFGSIIKLQNQKQLICNWFSSIDQQYLDIRKNLKKKIYLKYGQQIDKIYLNNQGISQYFQDQNIKQLKINKNNLEELALNNLQKCIQYSTKRFTQKIQQFISNQSNQTDKILRYLILNKIYYQAIETVKKDLATKKQKRRVSVNMKNGTYHEQMIIENAIIDNKNNDKSLFVYDSDQKKIILYYSPNLIVKILSKYEKQFQLILDCDPHLELFNKQPPAFRKLFTRQLLQVLFQNKYKLYLTINKRTQLFIVDNLYAYAFCHIPKLNKQQEKKSNYSITSSLKVPIKQFINLNNSNNYTDGFSIICLPCQTNYNDKFIPVGDRDKMSKCIDFILIKMPPQSNLQQKIIQIWMINICLSDNSSSINKKIKDFGYQFKKFKKNQKYSTKQLFGDDKNQVEDYKLKLKYCVMGNTVESQYQNLNDFQVQGLQQVEIGAVSIKNMRFINIDFQLTEKKNKQIILFQKFKSELVKIYQRKLMNPKLK